MIAFKKTFGVFALALIVGLAAGGLVARAEVKELRISQQFGISYLPIQVARHQGLFDKHAKALGLEGLRFGFVTLSGGSSNSDALLSNSIDIATGGVGAFLPIWAKTRGTLEVRAIVALSTLPIMLITTNPAVKTLADFTDKDRIALPSVKSSIQAVTLQMAAEAVFGVGNHQKLDDLTVSMRHPDGYLALASGKSEITAHFSGPPFQELELALPNARKLASSYELLGGPVTLNVAWARDKFRVENPTVLRAFVDGLEEADAFIAANPEAAAAISQAEEKTPATQAQILAIIKDPGAKFSIVPVNTMKYADFMFRTGLIGKKATDWKDLFFPEIHGRTGS